MSIVSDICRMYAQSYLESASHILDLYRGEMPFAARLKQFFREDKKYGSRDRKYIAQLCYCYFRMGKLFSERERKQRIIAGLFLCSTEPNPLLEQLMPGRKLESYGSVADKLYEINGYNEWQNIFPWQNELSKEIDAMGFTLSFFVQPDTCLRLRPGKEESVKRKLQTAGLSFREISPDCVALASGTNIEAIVKLDEEAVVQDYSSQQTLNLLFDAFSSSQKTLSVWDCCAASGGKSILLKDRWPGCRLTVSDVRESILINLRKRFKRAGIADYDWFVANLVAGSVSLKQPFDVIICDVPCTGSGTWSRTPEQLYFFEEKRIEEYAAKQKSIVTNVVQNLKPGGYLVYITCSVFRKENEEVVDFIQNNLPLPLQTMRYITGYKEKADTLFVALFQKS